MRRILLVLAVGAIMVLSSVSYAFAYATPDNNGNAANAPGQVNARANCSETSTRQGANDVSPNGGLKEEHPGPTDCDHHWQIVHH